MKEKIASLIMEDRDYGDSPESCAEESFSYYGGE